MTRLSTLFTHVLHKKAEGESVYQRVPAPLHRTAQNLTILFYFTVPPSRLPMVCKSVMIAGSRELTGNCPNSAPSSPSIPSGVSIGDTRQAHPTRIPLRGSKCNLVLFIYQIYDLRTGGSFSCRRNTPFGYALCMTDCVLGDHVYVAPPSPIFFFPHPYTTLTRLSVFEQSKHTTDGIFSARPKARRKVANALLTRFSTVRLSGRAAHLYMLNFVFVSIASLLFHT